MMQKNAVFLLLAWALLALGCDPKDEAPEPKDFSCIKLIDENGLGLGIYGACSTAGQWESIALDNQERALLNFSDTVSLAGTVPATIMELAAFPNPVAPGGPMHFFVRADSSGLAVKVKLAVVDSRLNVLQRVALRVNTNSAFALQFPPDIFKTGEYYRVYYQLSAAGNESLFEGYGNVLVCKALFVPGSTTLELDCK